MSIQQRHEDVAAYALGVLEPGDAFLFEEHLADCVICTVQLSDFGPAASALSDLAATGVADTRPSPLLLDRLADEVTRLRRRSRRRRFRLIAAAAALIVALPSAALAARSSGGAPDGRAGAGAVTARNTATGVTASAVVEDRPWGTAVAMRLSGLKGPVACRLIAVGRDGIEHPVLSWKVPATGYGGERRGGGTALGIEGGTDVPSAEIARWEVRTFGGRTLVVLGG
ncbi:zf-HC2 domain-containing protein [Streptomyces sp. NPDC051018]|uniref:zf-HC2 domain-containing protein n=1 Tax=Streptomyces sp. NPDC051018 TaxID=3365639 RepID=UPI0037AE9FA8